MARCGTCSGGYKDEQDVLSVLKERQAVNGDASATLQCDSTGHGQDSAPGSLQNLCSPEQVSATMALEPSKKNGYRRLWRELPSRKDLHSQGQVASISFSKVTA